MSFRSRLKEPSTHAGLAAILVGVGQVLNVHDAAVTPQAADAVVTGITAGVHDDWALSIAALAAGVAAIFAPATNREPQNRITR